MKARKPGKYVVGRQYTKRVVEVHESGTELVQIDRREFLNDAAIEQHKLAAIDRLEAAGIPAREILAEYPGGSRLRDYVLNYREYEADSAVGLAARICELCIRLQELPKLGAGPSMLMGEAYRLGRLLLMADVYGTQEENIAKARKKRAVWTEDEKNDAINRARDMQQANPKLTERAAATRLEKLLGIPSETIRGWLKK
jgi:hypothetical protein